MELFLERKYKKSNYTIGKLYINGKYFSNTIEDKDRNQQEVQNQTELEKEAAADTPAHQSYTIQPGDTMTRISVKNYGTIKKIKEICELNNMSETDTIYPGQIILLP